MENTRPESSEEIPEDEETTAESEHADTGDPEDLTARLAEAEKENADLRDALQRERADTENQRRRMQRDVEQKLRKANEGVLGELLPVCDNLEQGLLAETDNVDALREGMQMTLKSLDKVMAEQGVEKVDPEGETFDPEKHEAMSTVPTNEQDPDTVVTVIQNGYLLNGRLLRPARVMVAKEPSE